MHCVQGRLRNHSTDAAIQAESGDRQQRLQQCIAPGRVAHRSNRRRGHARPCMHTRTVLYCTVLYCTVLYCAILYCTVLYCTVLYCTVLCYTVLCYTVLYCAILYCTVLCIPDSCPRSSNLTISDRAPAWSAQKRYASGAAPATSFFVGHGLPHATAAAAAA
jgi:hypothetical protein